MDVGPRKLCGGSVAKIRLGKPGNGAASARFALLAASYLVPTGIRESLRAPLDAMTQNAKESEGGLRDAVGFDESDTGGVAPAPNDYSVVAGCQERDDSCFAIVGRV